MMLWGIIGIILAALAAVATIDIQHKNNARLKSEIGTVTLEREAARAANKSLSDSIDGVKKKCDDAVSVVRKQTTIDKQRQATAKATIAARAAIPDIKIAPLEASVAAPVSAVRAEQCTAAETILLDLAKDRK